MISFPQAQAPDPGKEKKAYYSKPEVVADYDDWRFRSKGGQYVDRVEQEAVLRHLLDLPKTARILDMPIGTGRLAHTLMVRGFTAVEGSDYSPAMLKAAARRCGSSLPLSRQDAFATGWADGTFSAVVSLRFTFHNQNLFPLIKELSRLLKPGGILVFDTIRWTPRSRLASLQKSLGGRIWAHKDAEVRAILDGLGLVVEAHDEKLLLPSFGYRFVPGIFLPVVQGLENILPPSLRSKAFWAVRKTMA